MTYPPQQPDPRQQPGQPYPQQPYPQQPGGYPQQQPGTYPQQPGAYPPPRGYQAAPPPVPPKKRGKGKVVLLAVAGVLLLCCGGGAIYTVANSGGSSSSASGTSGGTTSGGGSGAHAKVGQAVRDGKFEFTVQQVKCGVAQVGQDPVAEKAQGQFCLVTMSVKNIGNEAQTFDGSSQKALGADGKQYADSTAAEVEANQGTSTFLNQINPGNAVSGVLVFDIPAGASIKSLELHDSPFSGGVTVDVG